MIAQVVALDDYRPHLSVAVNNPDGTVTAHVIPVSLALEWAAGEKPLPVGQDGKLDEALIRRIIVEWLCFLCPGMEYPP